MLVQVIPSADSDAEELSDLAALLRDELLDLDVVSVDPLPAGQAPENSKGVLAAVGGWLAVNLGTVALRKVVDRVTAWAGRNDKTVEISLGGDVLKVTGITQDQQKRLIDEWLARQDPVA